MAIPALALAVSLNVVTDCGAIGDGVANDTVPIQACLNRCRAASDPCEILLPAPHTFLSNGLNYSGADMRFTIERGATLRAASYASGTWPQQPGWVSAQLRLSGERLSVGGGGLMDARQRLLRCVHYQRKG